MIKKIAFSLGCLLFIGSFQVIALEAGWINHFGQQTEHYRITRGASTIPIEFFTILEVGDQVFVDHEAVLELYLRGGLQRVKVTAANSPFQIDETYQVPEEANALWSWIKERFHQWHQIEKTQPAEVSACTNISLPLLANITGPALLVAGKKPLYLQWYGGQPPFTVNIKQGRHVLLLTQISYTSTIETEAINFETNKSYRVIVTDATGQMFVGGFKTSSQNLTPPLILENVSWTDDIDQTLRAIWLIEQLESNWTFEAYQQLAKFPQFQPALLLKNSLSQGQEKITCRGLRG